MVGHSKKRLEIIGRLVKTINEADLQGIKIDIDAMVKMICAEYGSSKRTAQEYIDIAKYTVISNAEQKLREGAPEGIQANKSAD